LAVWTDGSHSPVPRKKRLIYEKDVKHRSGQTRLKFI